MPLIVEDGTGLASAESYASITDLAVYAGNFNINISGLPDTASQEAALRKATQFIDGAYRFPGIARREEQALRWPRTDVTDDEGYAVDFDIVPSVVKTATILAAIETISGPLDFTNAEANIRRIKKKVEGLEKETEYDGPKGTTRKFPEIDRLLKRVGGNRTAGTVRLVRS